MSIQEKVSKIDYKNGATFLRQRFLQTQDSLAPEDRETFQDIIDNYTTVGDYIQNHVPEKINQFIIQEEKNKNELDQSKEKIKAIKEGAEIMTAKFQQQKSQFDQRTIKILDLLQKGKKVMTTVIEALKLAQQQKKQSDYAVFDNDNPSASYIAEKMELESKKHSSDLEGQFSSQETSYLNLISTFRIQLLKHSSTAHLAALLQ